MSNHGSGLSSIVFCQKQNSGAGRHLFIPVMYYVYFLRSKIKPGQFYVGYTEDLQARLKKHNAGEVQSTKPYGPWILIYYEAFTSMNDAKQREQYLKTTKGRRTLRLMLQDTLR